MLLAECKECQSGLWVLSGRLHGALDRSWVPRLFRARTPPHTTRMARHPHPSLLLQFEIRQLRAHLAQQGLDLAAEREAALLAPQVLSLPRSRYHVREDRATQSVVQGLQPLAGKPPWDARLRDRSVCAKLPRAGVCPLAGRCSSLAQGLG